MDEVRGEFYFQENQLFKSYNINYKFNTSGYLLYEVVRSQNGVLIFLQEHLDRLSRSILSINLYNKTEFKKAENILKKLVSVNNDKEGNIKLLVKRVDQRICFSAYYIQHNYPDESLYKKGVDLITYKIQRPDPHLKQVAISDLIRREITDYIKGSNVFEVLLVNESGYVTEGSKSNVFFIRNEEVITATDESVLKGITRGKVIEILEEGNIKLIKRNIHLKELNSFKGAIICGTSPKVIPVRKVDNINYVVNNSICRYATEKFNEIFQNYITRYK
ncbi:MAG: aminotransferase class IV family protein [Bacteroidales bacterium]|nr:aminotransferase class IV family protein [Bacteroidales bacterium]